MKLPFTIYDLRHRLPSRARDLSEFTIWRKSADPAVATRHSPLATRHSQRGVALIITLILLSVVTFMAITFLALSRRERSAVTTVTDTASARLAADAALANAEAQVIANVLSTTNPFNFGLLVSTNFINPIGFQPAPPAPPALYTSLTNVNYQYQNGNPLNAADFRQNLINLFYSPRAPVFIPTNSAGANDFRFYLDLNRNGRFESNGWVANLDNYGNIILDGLGNAVTSIQVGDPEWIGILERPDAPYGPNNKFIARYAFIAVPVGNTLDLNAIHNQAQQGLPRLSGTGVNPSQSGYNDNFVRNEGVSSWEINLAAFLADLNTNKWLPVMPPDVMYYWYQYGGTFPVDNRGCAFDDARALLAYRYNNNLNSLNIIGTAPNNLFGTPGVNAFSFDHIDGFSYGGNSLMTGLQVPTIDNDSALIAVKIPWVGADNTNHFFTHQELFNSNEISPTFVNRLLAAGNTNSTYDRYTFYRLLSQLGTDTAPDSGKMNLNYRNVDTNGNIVPGMETNFISWTNALTFFTNAADRLLRAYTTEWRNSNPTNFAATFYSVTDFTNIIASQWTTNYLPFGIGNIPVLVSNRFVYSPAVNRLLQLAANMYDATTNSFYPSVFRPTFWVVNTNGFKNVYINGYADVSQYSSQFGLTIGNPPLDLPVLITSSSLVPNALVNAGYGNVYGVPWIIGAKKGLPSFNQLYMVNVAEITRKLEVTRDSANLPLDFSKYATNQMYVISITNNIGISFWNSYSNDYPRPLTVYAFDWIQMTLANSVKTDTSNVNFTIPSVTINAWPGSHWGASTIVPPLGTPNTGSFYFTNWSFAFKPESIYRLSTGELIPYSDSQLWETNLPLWGLDHQGPLMLMTTNSLQAFILDGNHVIDYVQLRGPIDNTNLNQVLADPDYPDLTHKRYQWSANLYQSPGPMTYGVYNQLIVSENPNLAPGNSWIRPPGMPSSLGSTPEAESAFFNGFFVPSFQFGGNTYANSQLSVQAPYTPTRMAYGYFLWQANDPLVHYLASDLNYLDPGITGWHQSDDLQSPTPSQNVPGKRYQPWGLNKQMAGLVNVDTNAYNLAYKDPLIWCPDNWDFPINKFPTVGWLGRVHRGTPWQTVYLKASNLLKQFNMIGANPNYIGTNTWAQWTGDTELTYGQYFDAVNSAPLQDRLLFDLFTTAFNDNATRGTLSVNQSGLASWSALFSGMVALSNNTAKPGASYTARPTTDWTIINPVGVNTAINPPLWQMVTNINGMRSLYPQGVFTHVGDILSVPALTERSRFLNTNAVTSFLPPLKNGISDELYEWLPQQAMSLLRCSGSPRYVIYCYGQTLKPAPNAIYTGSGPFFGMVTNYQVVSEIATRAVVRFNSAMTNVVTFTTTNNGVNLITNWFSVPVVMNNNAVIESFNILPPD